MRTVLRDQNIDIEIDIIEHAVRKSRRDIYVAVIVAKQAVRFMKPENIVTAVEPVIFVRDRAAFDQPEMFVVNVAVECADKYEQGTMPFNKIALPAFCDAAVKFSCIDCDWFVEQLDVYTLHLFLLYSAAVRTTNTEHGAWWTTESETEPSNRRSQRL